MPLDFGGRVMFDRFGVTFASRKGSAPFLGGNGGTRDITPLINIDCDMLDFGGRVALDLEVAITGPFRSTVLLANRVGSFGIPMAPSLVAFANASRGTPATGPGMWGRVTGWMLTLSGLRATV